MRAVVARCVVLLIGISQSLSAYAWSLNGISDFMRKTPVLQGFTGEPPACSDNPHIIEGLSAEQLFQKGSEVLARGQANEACDSAHYFFEVLRQYPLSPEYRPAWAQMIAALRTAKDYIYAINEANRFLEENPKAKEAEFVHYQIMLSVSEQMGTSERSQYWTMYGLGAQSDQHQAELYTTNLAFKSFIDKYPESSHRAEVEGMLVLARQRVADSYLSVGKFYFKSKEYRAAIGRLAFIAQNGQKMPVYEEAMYYLALSFSGFAQQIENGKISDGRLRELTALDPNEPLPRLEIAQKARENALAVQAMLAEKSPAGAWTSQLKADVVRLAP